MAAHEPAEQALQAEQAEAKPTAAAEAKPKPPPLAKPKGKPQPQAPHPQSPPLHLLAAKKSAKAAPGHTEVEEMRGGLRGLSASLVARKGANAKLESKVSQWETKLMKLQVMGDEDRIRMAEQSLCKANEKVEEKEEAIETLDRSVRRMETILPAEVDKVKAEEVEEVVEVEVEAEEMVEETVEEEVEAKVVVETAVGGGGGGQWLRYLLRSRDAGAIQDLPWDPAILAGPQPPNVDHPLPVAPESPVRTLRFLLQRVQHRLFGGGGGVWVDEGGGSTWTSPCPWGRSEGGGGGNGSCRGRNGGDVPPHENGGEDVRVGATQPLHPREEKREATH